MKIVYNLLGLILSLLILKAVFEQPGYKFVDSMLTSNYEVVKKNRKATLDQRYQAKLGTGYMVPKYVADNTPEDAVILWPDADDFYPKGKKSAFKGELYRRAWIMRFVYPRKLVMKADMGKVDTSGITHVVVVNDSCKEFLPYPVNQYVELAVFPVEPKK